MFIYAYHSLDVSHNISTIMYIHARSSKLGETVPILSFPLTHGTLKV